MGRGKLKIWLKLLVSAEPRYGKAKYETARYAARYRFDPTFRAKEITRANLREAWKAGRDDGTLTPETLTRLYAEAKHCHYCAKPIKGKEKTLDHVVPLARGGAHSIHNAVIACWPCNNSKKAKDVGEWLLSRCAA